jgi:hypothetical protein
VDTSTPQPFYLQGFGPRYPSDRRPVAPRVVWTLWSKKKSLAPAEKLSLAVQTQITILKNDTIYT